MTLVKNPILNTLGKMIGISPSARKAINLDDENISMTLPVVPDLTRRALAGIQNGWFLGLMENVHSGADNEASNIDPYTPGALAVAPYPEAIDDDFDLWLLGVSGIRSAGAGGLTGAFFTINPPDTSQGWGVDDAGVQVLGTPAIKVAQFDAISTLVATTFDPMITEQGLLYQPIGMRLPRGVILGFVTESAAAAEFQGQWLMGLFPAGLGQDIVT